jgi:CubicO group peptidase (beta-lactamase class C family)
MKLVEAGRLGLDEPIGAHLPQLPSDWRTVPVRRLLNHTSGLPDMAVDSVSTRMLGKTTAETLALLADRPLDAAVGEKYLYNQTNYLLLGLLIEKVSGQPFVDYLQRSVLIPGGARNAVFGDSRVTLAGRSPVYTPFRYDGPQATVMDHLEALAPELWELPPHGYPTAGLNISIRDFARWLSQLLQGGILNRASLRELWTSAVLADGTVFRRPPAGSLWNGSGLGWVLGDDAAHPFVGGTGGNRSAFFYYPQDDISVIVLTNTQGTAPESFAAAIAQRYFR